MTFNYEIIKKKLNMSMEAKTKIYNIVRFPKEMADILNRDNDSPEVFAILYPEWRIILLLKKDSKSLLTEDDENDDYKILPLLENLYYSAITIEEINGLTLLKESYRKSHLIGSKEDQILDLMKLITKEVDNHYSIENDDPYLHNSGVYARLENDPIEEKDHLVIDFKNKIISFHPYNISISAIAKLEGKYGLSWDILPISGYFPGYSIGIRGIQDPVKKYKNEIFEDIFSKSEIEDSKRNSLKLFEISSSDVEGWKKMIMLDFAKIKSEFLLWKAEFEYWFNQEVEKGIYRKDELQWIKAQPIRKGQPRFHQKNLFLEFHEVRYEQTIRNTNQIGSEEKPIFNQDNYLEGLVYGWKINRYLDNWDMNTTVISYSSSRLNANLDLNVVILDPTLSEDDIALKFNLVIDLLKKKTKDELHWYRSAPPTFLDRIEFELKNKLLKPILCPSCHESLTNFVYMNQEMIYSFDCPKCKRNIHLKFEEGCYKVIL